jgi:hypothetical protein
MITIAALKAPMVPILWDKIVPMLEGPIEHSNNELSVEGILEDIMDERMLLLTISKDRELVACITVEQKTFVTGKKILSATTAGGTGMSEWVEELNNVLELLAKDYGCDDIYIVGRPGWEKALNKLNYKKIHTVVSRKVGE